MSEPDSEPPVNASSGLLPDLYDRLRAFAKARFHHTNSLFGTELVHEAYLRVAKQEDWDDVAHFFGAMRNAMRNVIVDHLRKKGRDKHGGNLKKVEWEDFEIEGQTVLPQLVALNDAVDELQRVDERAAKIVTLRFFACMTEDEICKELDLSRRTVSRDWAYAKAWLAKEMQGNQD